MSEKGRGEDRKEHRAAGAAPRRRRAGEKVWIIGGYCILFLNVDHVGHVPCPSSHTTDSTALSWRANHGDIQGRSLDILRCPSPATAISDRCVPESNPTIPCLLPRRRQAVRTGERALSFIYAMPLLMIYICGIVWEYMVRSATRVPVAAAH